MADVGNGVFLKVPMAHALRHRPDMYNLTLADDGSVLLDELADALSLTIDQVLYVVAHDSKKRYELLGDENNVRIRAAHGHTVDVNIDMNVVTDPGTLFHGTKVRFLSSILRDGLNRMNRNYVHLSKDVPTALDVARRRRVGDNAILMIDGSALSNNGADVYVASTGIYLTHSVPVEFITEIVYI